MKKRAIMFLMATVVAVSMININTVSVHAMTQDEYLEAINQYCAENGLNPEDYNIIGGTVNVAGGQEAIAKAEEVQKKLANETPAEPQPTKATEPTQKAEESKKEVVETVAEPTVEETTEEPATIEEEITAEEITTTEEMTSTEEITTEEETTTEEVEEETENHTNWLLIGIIAIVIILAGAGVTLFIKKK